MKTSNIVLIKKRMLAFYSILQSDLLALRENDILLSEHDKSAFDKALQQIKAVIKRLSIIFKNFNQENSELINLISDINTLTKINEYQLKHSYLLSITYTHEVLNFAVCFADLQHLRNAINLKKDGKYFVKYIKDINFTDKKSGTFYDALLDCDATFEFKLLDVV